MLARGTGVLPVVKRTEPDARFVLLKAPRREFEEVAAGPAALPTARHGMHTVYERCGGGRRAIRMRLTDGRYQCLRCGAVLDIPTDREPQVVIVAASGEPNMRTIVYEGVEIHRCEVQLQRRQPG